MLPAPAGAAAFGAAAAGAAALLGVLAVLGVLPCLFYCNIVNISVNGNCIVFHLKCPPKLSSID